MKTAVLFFTLSIFSFNALANKIDSLKTDEQVLNFVKNLNIPVLSDSIEILSDKVFTETVGNWQADTFHYSMAKKFIEKTSQKFWQTLDLNADGEIDLLATIIQKGGFHTIVIAVLAKNNNTYTVKTFNRFFVFDEAASAIRTEGTPCILLNRVDFSDCMTFGVSNSINVSGCPIKTDTLAWKFDDFVDLNSQVINHHIVNTISIDETDAGWIEREASNIQIDLASGDIVYYKQTSTIKDGDKAISGKGFIAKEDAKKIESLINYIDFVSLKDTFDCHTSDVGWATLRIGYDNGQVKNIYDLGANGTYGLMVLYNTLINIKYSNTETKQ